MAKSFVWVQKMARSPARATLVGRVTTTIMITTKKNMIVFEMNIARMNIQLTDDRSSLHSEIKINEGRENFPTKVFNPEVSRRMII